MVVGAVASRTDLAIIGAGPGGYVAALRAADAGLEVALIEREHLGGTCLNVGCIPSKALIDFAHAYHRVASSPLVEAVSHFNAARWPQELARVTDPLTRGVRALLREAGVELVQGAAHFATQDRLSIAHRDQVAHLEFENVIIATGSRPTELPGFDVGGRVLDSTGALSLDELPESMAIIGGGYIGVELGTAWAKLGSRVTIIDAADTVLPSIDPDLRRPVEAQLRALGVDLALGVTCNELTAGGLELSDGRELEGSVVVVAVGRTPNTDNCSLDVAPVQILPSGHIRVDAHQRAGPGVYAIGDVVPGPALAHKASAEAEIAVDAIVHRPNAGGPVLVAEVVFSDPEIMSVGVRPDVAASQGLSVHRFAHAASARARTLQSNRGSTTVVSDPSGTVVGVHVVGPHASELAGEAALAIELAATVEDLTLTVHPHPTMSESIVEAAWLARGMPMHVRT